MKARVISSLALPAALATAGLLHAAEAAYTATLGSDTLEASTTNGYRDPLIGSPVKLTSGDAKPCTPMGNVTITDYGHCCTTMGNVTVTDYGHCCTSMGNITVCDYGHHQDHSHHDHDHGRQERVADW